MKSLLTTILMLSALFMAGCGSDDDVKEENTTDFSQYENPCDAVLGRWQLIASDPMQEDREIVFSIDQSWNVKYDSSGKEDAHGYYTLVKSTDETIPVVRADKGIGYTTNWLLRLGNDKEFTDFYQDYGIVIVGNRMYLSTWGYTVLTSSYIFQHK